MNHLEKIQLDKMISENNVEDQTNKIRELKHSALIKRDIDTILQLQKLHPSLSFTELDNMCIEKSNFLFVHYPNIYTKLLKKEIDVSILYVLVETLQEIENNKLSQHEASFKIGKILKKIYIDTALKHANKLDDTGPVAKLTPKKINWNTFKHKKIIEY